MTAQPAGPWVVVVGMHRSGTSAVAGALGGLGLQMVRPGDRMAWADSNPEHWESLSLSLHNENLLHSLGGGWDAPPALPPHWIHSAAVMGGTRSGRVLAEAYPEKGPAAVKDPRLCLLLPHWRTVLPGPLAALLVWRRPVDVARSLERRDGLPPATGLALWERYNRSALRDLAGVDTFVAPYEDVVADPSGCLAGWADWLGSLAQFSPHRTGWDVDRGAKVIAPELHHQVSPSPAEEDGIRGLLSEQQAGLADRLAGLAGSHRPLIPPDLGAETPWVEALLAARREVARGRWMATAARERFWTTRGLWAETRAELARVSRASAAEQRRLEAERDGARAERDGAREALADTQARLAELYGSTSWKVTGPLRSSLARLEGWTRRPPAPRP